MKRIAAVFLCVFLSGCWSDLQKQYVVCGRGVMPFKTEFGPAKRLALANDARSCMAAHGYQFVLADCPIWDRVVHDKTPRGLMLLQAERYEEPFCYEPATIMGSAVHKIQTSIGF
jgi:hypothetical protein